ncbi:Protein of unknown function DUF1676 [Cinara cedri]|uniref:Uncharacterized protein n=1 Tax=Cinara cedri TaxID=506608 RepID=A0A5E4MZV1_9HEMI|nr:Protein of unknown function DUF1676 [Cinara cedri]
MSPSIAVRRVSCVCAAVAIMTGAVSSLPATQLQRPQRENGPTAAGGGSGVVAWSALAGCFDPHSTEPATVCLKSKALTALTRTLRKSTVDIANGVSLAARADAPLADPPTEEADRAALDAAEGPEQKNALLDRMIGDRLDALVSTKAIVLDGPTGQEGRGRRKQQKTMRQAVMMASVMMMAVLGPMAFSVIALLAGKALLVSKIALVLSGLIALKKLFQTEQGSGHSVETIPHYYDRNLDVDAHAMAYLGQQQLYNS